MSSIFNRISSLFYVTFIFDDRYLFFLEGLKNTLILTICSFILGSMFGVVLCQMFYSKNKFVRDLANALKNLFTEMPTMVLLMIMVYMIFGRTSLPVMWIVIVGLTFKSGAYLSEIFNTAVNSVAPGEIEAARTLGLSKLQAFRYVTLPQAVTTALPLYTNQFIVSMQETSIVGFLAITDLTRASSIVASRTMSSFFGLTVITLIYFLIGYLAKVIFKLLGSKRKGVNA